VQPAEIYTSVSGAGCCGSFRVGWFCFFFSRGLILLISAASRFVLMCAAYYFSIIWTLVRQFLAIW